MHFVHYINTFNDVLLAEAKAKQVYDAMHVEHKFDYVLTECPGGWDANGNPIIVYKIIIDVYGRAKKKDKL